MHQDARHHVVIAGGGVAGLEALIALWHLARQHVRVTLVAPTDEFLIRALSVQDPFARPAPKRYALAEICRDHGAEFRRDAVRSVDPAARQVELGEGGALAYDSLLVAVGAQAEPVFERTLTFRGMQDAEALHGLIQDVEAGVLSRVAFVVPPGTTWPLPIYELALMTAERAYGMGMDVALTIVTPEPEPLHVFGRVASERVDALLAERGIVVRTAAHVESVDGGTVLARPGDIEVKAQRVVALPRLSGPRIAGLPADGDGFLPVDDLGRVRDTAGVYAAGDGTTMPIKQGGIAALQAGASARAIAAEAGANVVATPFKPVLRAQLLTGAHSTYLRQHVAGGAGDTASTASDHALWWPPAKVAAPHLTPYLERLDAGEHGATPHGSSPHTLHGPGDPSGGVEALG
jgi:sulfide:quinone oxidoreductase